jgi:hypothetical protein
MWDASHTEENIMNMTNTNNTNNTGSTLVPLPMPEHITDLRSSGILVTCLMHSTTLTVTDRNAGNEMADRKGASRQSVELRKKLAGNMPQLKNLQNLRQTMYNGLRVHTYDWAGDSRYLPSQRFEAFSTWWVDLQKQHAEAKAAFLEAWPDVVSAAAFELGDLFNRDDYPTAEQLAGKFYMEMIQAEVPAGDFRNVLFHEALGDAHASLQRHASNAISGILEAQMKQLGDVMRSLSKACEVETVYDAPGGKIKTTRGRLYQTTVERALELCDMFSQFNPSKDADLREARNMLAETLRDVTYDNLRESDTMRVEVKKSVDDILNKFKF